MINPLKRAGLNEGMHEEQARPFRLQEEGVGDCHAELVRLKTNVYIFEA